MTEVKICGLSTPDLVEVAIAAGADYIGFVVFPKSPRHVDIETAAKLRAHVAGRAQTVVLLVDPDDALLDQVTQQVKPDIVQLHGDETPERVTEIKRRHACAIWKAVPVAMSQDISNANQYVNSLDLILFDAKPPTDAKALPGGNGLKFDWRILSDANSPNQPPRPFALAGGLTPKNVAAAIELVAPKIVDVSSGVESAPGIKDPELIQGFIRAVNTAKQVD